MPKPKSFLKNISIDTAKRTHYCQHIPSHRINVMDSRLKLKVDRSQEYFCAKCAIESIDRDIETLLKIKDQLIVSQS